MGDMYVFYGGVPDDTRHSFGPGAALPADTQTDGASLPRKTREELEDEFVRLFPIKANGNLYADWNPITDWFAAQKSLLRLAYLAGQIARMEDSK